MRLHSFSLHNVGPFAHAALDLDSIDGTVIAVCGANWAGKTTALEAGFAGARCSGARPRSSARERSCS